MQHGANANIKKAVLEGGGGGTSKCEGSATTEEGTGKDRRDTSGHGARRDKQGRGGKQQ